MNKNEIRKFQDSLREAKRLAAEYERDSPNAEFPKTFFNRKKQNDAESEQK